MVKINMDHAPIVKALIPPRVLVAPLDWGLGHATRCIPVIYELISAGAEVLIAGDGSQRTILEKEFPQLSFLDLPGYRVKYSRSARGFQWTLLAQLPRIVWAINHEHHWLKKLLRQHRIDIVISDNRFGLYNASTISVFMTHQLFIYTGANVWLNRLIQKINYRFVNHFTECWIPDQLHLKNSLAGKLSHPEKYPGIPRKFIGILSRLKRSQTPIKKNHTLFILSGPEPQRSILEDKIISEISHYNGTATVVRGLPNSETLLPSTNDIRIYNHLPTEELSEEISRAEYVICRSGYSSIMDMIRMQKKGILIPTPGQGEQEYLAAYLFEKRLALTISQQDFSLGNALHLASKFIYQYPDIEEIQLSHIITELLKKLTSTKINPSL